MWHARAFALENNNKVCRVYSVEASAVVLLHRAGNTEGWESVQWHSVCVCSGWGGGSSSVKSQKRKQTQQQTPAVVREMNKKPKYKSGPTEPQTQQCDSTHSSAGSSQNNSRCNITQSTPWHFEPLPISFSHNDRNNRKFQGTGGHESRWGIIFHEKIDLHFI